MEGVGERNKGISFSIRAERGVEGWTREASVGVVVEGVEESGGGRGGREKVEWGMGHREELKGGGGRKGMRGVSGGDEGGGGRMEVEEWDKGLSKRRGEWEWNKVEKRCVGKSGRGWWWKEWKER